MSWSGDPYGEGHLIPLRQIDYDLVQLLYHTDSGLVIFDDGESRHWHKRHSSLIGYLGSFLSLLHRLLGTERPPVKRRRWVRVRASHPALYAILERNGKELPPRRGRGV